MYRNVLGYKNLECIFNRGHDQLSSCWVKACVNTCCYQTFEWVKSCIWVRVRDRSEWNKCSAHSRVKGQMRILLGDWTLWGSSLSGCHCEMLVEVYLYGSLRGTSVNKIWGNMFIVVKGGNWGFDEYLVCWTVWGKVTSVCGVLWVWIKCFKGLP